MFRLRNHPLLCEERIKIKTPIGVFLLKHMRTLIRPSATFSLREKDTSDV